MDSFVQLAARRRLDCVIVACEAPPPVLRKRLVERARNGTDASEADLGVLDSQLRGTAAAPVESTARIVRVDTSQDVDIPGLCRSIKDCRPG
jgi:predicted kinase